MRGVHAGAGEGPSTPMSMGSTAGPGLQHVALDAYMRYMHRPETVGHVVQALLALPRDGCRSEEEGRREARGVRTPERPVGQQHDTVALQPGVCMQRNSSKQRYPLSTGRRCTPAGGGGLAVLVRSPAVPPSSPLLFCFAHTGWGPGDRAGVKAACGSSTLSGHT